MLAQQEGLSLVPPKAPGGAPGFTSPQLVVSAETVGFPFSPTPGLAFGTGMWRERQCEFEGRVQLFFFVPFVVVSDCAISLPHQIYPRRSRTLPFQVCTPRHTEHVKGSRLSTLRTCSEPQLEPELLQHTKGDTGAGAGLELGQAWWCSCQERSKPGLSWSIPGKRSGLLLPRHLQPGSASHFTEGNTEGANWSSKG
jgi:hypothetical protein